jgi:CBS domain-containing protein
LAQDAINKAAEVMKNEDVGSVPVIQSEADPRLVGMVTDRDIVIRAVAQGRGGDARVADVMSREVLYCFDDEELNDVARNMGNTQVRRLPVVNRDKRLVGIISLGDVARNDDPTTVGRAVSHVSAPGGKHSQTH